jgi:hypothetical protein
VRCLDAIEAKLDRAEKVEVTEKTDLERIRGGLLVSIVRPYAEE